MKPHRTWLFALTGAFALGGLAAPVAADVVVKTSYFAQSKQRHDQGEARKEMKAGNQLSLREIEKRVLPKMRGAEYLGPAYDAAAHAYRLKFIKDGRVMYVDVDARTGRIINRSR
ncbi:MAG: PepSY domain-containing protein [Erythrobacter sp.]|uniref:PepSY domain-containing protein n=1 Tax=Erythrobacter sp. TaxID=1042 RepID=UPI002630539D|nr:PepSY domain-containing protein [Erythrobacter sp.]MDJ0977147.1 PepSY domain-containing protein [Erythrobacter sp.]